MSIYRENLVPRQFGLAKPFRTILARDHYSSRHGITQPTLRTNNSGRLCPDRDQTMVRMMDQNHQLLPTDQKPHH
jgi:hypothetical protein